MPQSIQQDFLGRGGARYYGEEPKEWTGQHKKLMDLFRARPNEWIPLPEILKLFISQYGRVIKELRESGEKIENKSEWVNGQRHTAFRWTGK